MDRVFAEGPPAAPGDHVPDLPAPDLLHVILDFGIAQRGRGLHGHPMAVRQREDAPGGSQVRREGFVHVRRFSERKNLPAQLKVRLRRRRRQHHIGVHRLVQRRRILEPGHAVRLGPRSSGSRTHSRTSRHDKSAMLQFVPEKLQVHVGMKVLKIVIHEPDRLLSIRHSSVLRSKMPSKATRARPPPERSRLDPRTGAARPTPPLRATRPAPSRMAPDPR